MMNVKFCLFLLITFSFISQACENDKGKDIPDVSGITSDVEILRFEKDLFSLDTNHMEAKLPALESKYGEFADVYFGYILGSKDPAVAPDGHAEYVKGFLSFPTVQQLYDTTQIVFPDVEELEKEFEQAFRFYKYYFPTRPLSEEVVTYISEYTIGGFLYGENSIGVGLDFYLGDQYPYLAYNPANPNFSKYLTHSFNKDYIVLKSMKLLVQDMLNNPAGDKLLDHMIHRGKELYVLEQLLPYAPDSVIMEYSEEQVNWVNDNEANIWAYLLQENLLYSSEFNKYRKLIEYSPNSPGMPDEAPGRTVSWLGWQIVGAFMERNPGLSLEDLIALNDAQAILDGSRYKPAR